MDSDVPVPYGRTVLRTSPVKMKQQYRKRNDVLVAIAISHCRTKNKRMEYVEQLQKHIPVDVYGACGNLK